MHRLSEAIHKTPDLCASIYDNASFLICEFFTKNLQAPYSPIHHTIFPIQLIKKLIQGTRFDLVKSIKLKFKEVLMEISKSGYEKCFQDWIKRWRICIVTGGDCFV